MSADRIKTLPLEFQTTNNLGRIFHNPVDRLTGRSGDALKQLSERAGEGDARASELLVDIDTDDQRNY